MDPGDVFLMANALRHAGWYVEPPGDIDFCGAEEPDVSNPVLCSLEKNHLGLHRYQIDGVVCVEW